MTDSSINSVINQLQTCQFVYTDSATTPTVPRPSVLRHIYLLILQRVCITVTDRES